MSPTCLHIRHLTCAYTQGRPVMEVPDLEVHRGELMFLLGRSGIGKSTFLELAGVMNLPAGSTEGEVVFQDPDKGNIPVLDLWNGPNQVVSAFRSAHLAFIFQETDLLGQFTSGENMILPAMVQGIGEEEARDRVLRMMDLLDLERGLFDQAPTHLSGGQKQRMAFIRALITDFDILFGDEPTGNLDPVSASVLMLLLRENLHTHSRTGLVVSHDIGLALKYADRIAVFTQHPEKESMGWLNPGHIFSRNADGWCDAEGMVPPCDMPSFLSGLIRTNK